MEKNFSYSEFTKAVVEGIKAYLPESFADASVEICTVIKNNNMKLKGLVISNEDNNVVPTIYLEQFYEKYKAGEGMDDVMASIASLRLKSETKEDFGAKDIIDFEKVKDRIIPRLVNLKWNKLSLTQKPHTILCDLAITYHILLGEKDGVMSVPIGYDLMNRWKITENDLYEIALKNQPRLCPTKVRSMREVISHMAGFDVGADIPADDTMFVITNKQQVNGAAALLDKEAMNKVVDTIGEDFIILPSSIHECIIVRGAGNEDIETISSMINEVNETQVSLEERLSDHPYKYSKELGLIPCYGDMSKGEKAV